MITYLHSLVKYIDIALDICQIYRYIKFRYICTSHSNWLESMTTGCLEGFVKITILARSYKTLYHDNHIFQHLQHQTRPYVYALCFLLSCIHVVCCSYISLFRNRKISSELHTRIILRGFRLKCNTVFWTVKNIKSWE